MNNSVINLWRENGSYLRFGDAKLFFLISFLTAELLLFVDHVQLTDHINFRTLRNIANLHEIGTSSVPIYMCLVAIFIAVFGIIPSISKRLIRVNMLICFGIFIRQIPQKPNNMQNIYFVDIASYPTVANYVNAVQAQFFGSAKATSADIVLIEQIWIISRIASSKYISFNISLYMGLAAIILSILGLL